MSVSKVWPETGLRGVNVKLVSYANEPEGSKFLTEANFQKLKSWNVNVIRVPFRVDKQFDTDIKDDDDADGMGNDQNVKSAKYKIPQGLSPSNFMQILYKDHLEGLELALRLAQKYNINIVITAGNMYGRKNQQPDYVQYLNEFWKYIAKNYGAHPNIIGYDLLNEPNTELEVKIWKTTLLPSLATEIRKYDRDTYLVIEPYPYSRVTSINNIEPIEDKKAIYSIHFYIPRSYTHQGIKRLKNDKGSLTYPGKLRDFKSSAEIHYDKEALRKIMEPAVQFQQKYNVKIFVGEFGVIRWAPNGEQYLADCISLFEEFGFSWANHSYVSSFNGFNMTFDADYKSKKGADGGKETARLAVLKSAFRKNVRTLDSKH